MLDFEVEVSDRDYSEWTGFQVMERVATPDPHYDSPMHVHTEYVSSDGDVFRPWKSRNELCIETLHMMIGFIGDWDEHDIDYVLAHGAHNGMDCETGELVAGPRCSTCGSPECRKFGMKNEWLCDNCIVKKEDRSYRRAPRPQLTQDVHGQSGFWAMINEQRDERGDQPFDLNVQMMPMGFVETRSYMDAAPKVSKPLTPGELEKLGVPLPGME